MMVHAQKFFLPIPESFTMFQAISLVAKWWLYFGTALEGYCCSVCKC